MEEQISHEDFKCEICKIDFPNKLAVTAHNAGKHKRKTCAICKEVFENRGELGRHKIKVHGYTPNQLGWGLTAGWNKGKNQIEAFKTIRAHHGTPEFMKNLNGAEYIKRKLTTRKYHEEVVVLKEKQLREQGFRTFNTSNYSHHNRVPDIIAISPVGKVVAIEMESIRPYKSSVESLRKKYTELLMKEQFFDDVIVEGFLVPDLSPEDSNSQV